MSDATDLEGLELRKALKLERYAEILAHVMHFGVDRAEEVVRRFGLEIDRWRELDRAWSSELALGMKRQQPGQALRFSSTFHKRRERLTAEQPPVSAVGDADAKPGPVARAPAAAHEPREVALPTFMVAAAQPARAPLPAPPPPAPAPAAPAPARAGTVTMDAMPVPAEAKLPFVPAASPSTAFRSAVSHAAAVQGPKADKPLAQSVTEPMGERLARLARGHVPFGSGPPASEPPDSDTPPSLTLEQHASLQVELEATPDQSAAVLRRYGLSAEQHAAIDASWKAKIAAEPALGTSWADAAARYRTWLQRKS